MTKSLLLLCIVLLSGCKTNQRKNGEREGLWIEKRNENGISYKSRGRFHNGFERKTWRFFENGKLVRKEVYKDSVCHVTKYFENGKIMLQGQTRLQVTDKLIRWYYFGDWHEFDPSGKLILISTYDNGELIGETEVK